MYGFLRRPKWIVFHVVCVIVSATMAILGVAQVLHLQDRTERNDALSAASHAPIAPLSDLLGRPPADVEYRRVEASGTYLLTPTFTVSGAHQDDTDGSEVLAVLRLEDGTSVVVDRGFVADGLSVPTAPTGDVHLTCRLRRGSVGGPVDLEAISATLGEDVAPMYVELLASNPDEPDTVRPIPFPDLSSGPHLRYALQWFAFSGCVLLGWWVVVRRRYLRLQTERV